MGTVWIKQKISAVLRVPSVVIPRESNYMLNPEHPDFSRIVIEGPLAFQFDLRLVARLQWKVCGILVSEPARHGRIMGDYRNRV